MQTHADTDTCRYSLRHADTQTHEHSGKGSRMSQAPMDQTQTCCDPGNSIRGRVECPQLDTDRWTSPGRGQPRPKAVPLLRSCPERLTEPLLPLRTCQAASVHQSSGLDSGTDSAGEEGRKGQGGSGSRGWGAVQVQRACAALPGGPTKITREIGETAGARDAAPLQNQGEESRPGRVLVSGPERAGLSCSS